MWSIANIISMSVIIRAAYWEDKEDVSGIIETQDQNSVEKGIITLDPNNMVPVYSGKAI